MTCFAIGHEQYFMFQNTFLQLIKFSEIQEEIHQHKVRSCDDQYANVPRFRISFETNSGFTHEQILLVGFVEKGSPILSVCEPFHGLESHIALKRGSELTIRIFLSLLSVC